MQCGEYVVEFFMVASTSFRQPRLYTFVFSDPKPRGFVNYPGNIYWDDVFTIKNLKKMTKTAEERINAMDL